MKFTILEDLIVRIPQFPLNAKIEDHWEQLKESIKISSHDFYQTIKDVLVNETENLPRSVYHTVWKYFNRAKYRATPYGSFAGFGYLNSASSKKGTSMLIDSDQKLHKYICWTKHKKYSSVAAVTDVTVLFTNNSFYKINGQLRYLSTTLDGKFDLSEITGDETVMELLEDCRIPTSVFKLKQKQNWSEKKIAYIEELIRLQLLLTSFSPNIIGPDYFKRIGIDNHPELPQYILAERRIKSGYPEAKILEHIPGLINLMDKLLGEFKSPVLENFKKDFYSKFESRLISLMQALDPEIGISLVGNEEADNENAFIASFNQDKVSAKNSAEHVVETLLLHTGFDKNKKPIDLECLEQIFEPGAGKIPNSLSMLCSIVDEKIIMEHIGGATAVSVLGRYSIASEAIRNLCCSIVDQEQTANPDVLFFDIAYISEAMADNINRRTSIYPFQLSILNFDVSEEPLTMDDLFVYVEDDEIKLYSKRLKKRMIPRLSTAYNYNRSELPLFRFLCELQYQGLKSNLGFFLSDLVPNQDYYPRVEYKNIVISPAKWRISQNAYLAYRKASSDKNIIGFIRQFTEQRYIVIRTDDRTMYFDTGSEIDMVEFSFILKKFNNFYIEEGFIAENPILKDDAGNFYANQFVVSITQQTPVYSAMNPYLVESAESIKRSFVAGTEWLYYDIYVHPFRSDYLLQQKIAGFLKKNKSKIACWFFIRYNKDGNHLRLRMKLKNLEELGIIIIGMADMLEQELDSGLISEFRISRYERELERYSEDMMEQTEHLFYKDSRYVMSLLANPVTDFDKYKLCISFILRFRNYKIIEQTTFDAMLEKTSGYFLQEHEIKSEGFKLLNQQYKNFKEQKDVVLPKSVKKELESFESAFVVLLSNCLLDRKQKLFTDLLHMHINRMFAEYQRTHEMVIYYFLTKTLLHEKAIFKMHAIAN